MTEPETLNPDEEIAVDLTNGIGAVRAVSIENEMRDAYLDYAMSVIVSRALPDARDGLKPVQRRILYAMYDMGLRSNTPHRKSARIVGEVLGKYHPHGDTAVYDAMARMAQDFSLRYPLVDGQGNFGSVDGDSPAAMRYTEARLARIAETLLQDIDMDTVDWRNNFDDSLKEPAVLPAVLPNLLVNGASGIAVGMATNIPPHNLGEVADAIVYVIDNWERLEDIQLDELMQFVKGPDFPTGGIVMGLDGIRSAFATGRGHVQMRAVAEIEEVNEPLPHHRHRDTLPAQQDQPDRAHRRAGPGWTAGPDQRPTRRIRSQWHADRHRAEARRRAAEGAEPAVQVHAAAVHLRHQLAGAGQRRAAPRCR